MITVRLSPPRLPGGIKTPLADVELVETRLKAVLVGYRSERK
jgi:hypothetical protein